MKYKLMIIIIICLVIFGALLCIKFLGENKVINSNTPVPTVISEADYIDKILHESVEVDFEVLSEIKTSDVIKPEANSWLSGENIIWFEEISNSEWLKKFNEYHGLSVPGTDWYNNSLVVSYGKKIVKLRGYEYPEIYGNINNRVAVVTFSQVNYEYTLFVYVIKRHTKDYPVFISSYLKTDCFILEDGQEIYIGNSYTDFWKLNDK